MIDPRGPDVTARVCHGARAATPATWSIDGRELPGRGDGLRLGQIGQVQVRVAIRDEDDLGVGQQLEDPVHSLSFGATERTAQ